MPLFKRPVKALESQEESNKNVKMFAKKEKTIHERKLKKEEMDVITVIKYAEGCYKEDGDRMFTVSSVVALSLKDSKEFG